MDEKRTIDAQPVASHKRRLSDALPDVREGPVPFHNGVVCRFSEPLACGSARTYLQPLAEPRPSLIHVPTPPREPPQQGDVTGDVGREPQEPAALVDARPQLLHLGHFAWCHTPEAAEARWKAAHPMQLCGGGLGGGFLEMRTDRRRCQQELPVTAQDLALLRSLPDREKNRQ